MLGYEPPAPKPRSKQPYASWLQKKRRRDETNDLAKSCDVLHVVTCREPAGLDQTPEAGRSTKGNITKPFESIIFGGYQNSSLKPTNSKRDPNVNSLKHKRPEVMNSFTLFRGFLLHNHFLLLLVTPYSNQIRRTILC